MKGVNNFHNRKTLLSDTLMNSLKPVSIMVDSFVRSLSTANDSGSFDTSLEVKQIQPQRKRSKCVTELDREEIIKFVREFEQRRKNKLNSSKNGDQNNNNSVCVEQNTSGHKDFLEDSLIKSLKSSPSNQVHSVGNQKVNEKSIELVVSSTPIKTNEPEQDEIQVELRNHLTNPNNDGGTSSSVDSDFESTDQEFYEEIIETGSDDHEIAANRTIQEIKTPENQRIPRPTEEFRRTYSFKKPHVSGDEKQCKAARVLQFFSSARKKCKNNIKPASCSTSRSGSPASTRSLNFSQRRCKLFSRNYYTDEDDGFSTTESQMTSRNESPDSLNEMQAPIVPRFKITPPSKDRNAAYELAKILRGSFHARRASVQTLRRSLSDPENCRFDSDETPKKSTKDEQKEFVQPGSGIKNSLGTAIIRNLDLICEILSSTKARSNVKTSLGLNHKNNYKKYS